MNCNVGKTDRMLRIILGLVVILAGLWLQSWWGALGLVFVLTGLFRWCPLYLPFKISTNK